MREGPAGGAFRALEQQLTQARDRRGVADKQRIEEVVRAVLTTMSGDLGAAETTLLSEVEALGRTIASAKQEIASLRVDDIKHRDIPFATDELDAIVRHTADATNAILESCEILDEVAGTVGGDAAARLQEAVTKIYEACGFQDITGQRITKIVSTLKTIDTKIAHILDTFGARETAMETPAAAPEREDIALLNGPQLPEQAMDQSDIDKLLASFG